MRPDDLFEFTRTQPFKPFRIYTTDGRTYDVEHPDQIIVLRSTAVVAVGRAGRVPAHLEHLALIHLVRLEALEDAA